MTPWLCACHKAPMYWNIDSRYKRGGFWRCREKKRELNARRLRIAGSHIYMPDEDFKEYAIRIREDRKEAQRGREKN